MRTLVSSFCVLMLVGTAAAQPAARPSDEIRIRRLAIESATLPDADREQIIRKLESGTYAADTPAALAEEMRERIRDSLQVLGYFNASVAKPRISFLGQAGTQSIDMEAAVDEGMRYHLGEISFRNGTVFPAQRLRQAFPIQKGGVFNTEKIRKGMQNLRSLYGAKGYIYFTLFPNTASDDQRRTVDVTFDLDEGEPFYFGALVLDGPEPHPGAGGALLRSWKRLEGRPYDQDMLQRWIVENRSNLPRDVWTKFSPEWIEATPDQKSHLVNMKFRLP